MTRRRGGLSAALAAAVASHAIPALSGHALSQALLRGVTPHDIRSAIDRGTRYTQADGARVHVLRVHGRGYFYVVAGRNAIVTVSRKDLRARDVRRATIRYRWQR